MVGPPPAGPVLSELEEAHRCFLEHEPRDLFYRVATELLRLAREGATEIAPGEALAGLLLTWNLVFYRFRPSLAASLVDDLEAVLDSRKDAVESFGGRSIGSFSPADEDAVADLFAALEPVLGQVGTAKAMHLLAPRFFPLWDASIARAYGLGESAAGRNASRYLRFMNIVKAQCEGLGDDLVNLDNPLKVIDEFNYCHYTKGWL